MTQAVSILFGALFTVAVAVALGKMLLRRAGVPLDHLEEHAVAFVCGGAALSLLVFTAAAVRLARPAVFLAGGAAILALAWVSGAHRRCGGPSLPPLGRFWKWLFAAVYIPYAALYLVHAMAPEISPDGSAYHLGLVYRYLLRHGFYPITTNMYANLSQGVEMLFLFAFAFGKHSAAALVHCAFLLALPWLVLNWARRAGIPPAGVCGALLVFASPVVGIDGASAYVDVAVAAIVFTVFYLLEIWDGTRIPSLLAVVGLVAGFGYAAKYTAFVAVPYALAFVAWRCWRKRQPLVAPLLTVAIPAAVMILPWVLKNWMWVGNPFSPFFNSLFPNPYVTVGFEHEYRQFLRLNELKSYAELPLAVTVRGQVGGVIGPLFLLAPLALAALRRREGRRLLFAAAVFGSTYFGNTGARFLIWVLPFVAVAMSLAFLNVRCLAPLLVAVHAVLSWSAVMPAYVEEYAWRLDGFPWQAALRLEPEEKYLERKVSTYGAVRLIEQVVPPGEPVLTYTAVAEAYTSRDVRVVYQSASGTAMGDMLLTPLFPAFAPAWHLSFRFPPRQLRKLRVVQTAPEGPHYWSAAELRVYHGARELPRAPAWRLRASPNPWDVGMAFDNSPVTRWSSAQNLYSGMFLEVDFGRPETVDRVLLECSHDQYQIRLRLEGQDAAGRWVSLADAPEQHDVTDIPGLRGAATTELKRRGVRHFLLFDGDFGASDFRARSDEWGIETAGRIAGATVYRIP